MADMCCKYFLKFLQQTEGIEGGAPPLPSIPSAAKVKPASCKFEVNCYVANCSVSHSWCIHISIEFANNIGRLPDLPELRLVRQLQSTCHVEI